MKTKMNEKTRFKVLSAALILMPYVACGLSLWNPGGVIGFFGGFVFLSMIVALTMAIGYHKYLAMIGFSVMCLVWCIGWEFSNWSWKSLLTTAIAFLLTQWILRKHAYSILPNMKK